MTTTIDDEEENPRDRSMPIRIREGQIWAQLREIGNP